VTATQRTASTEPRHFESISSWDLEAEVVVVGLGCAGACAAIEAAAAGADVLVLERAAAGGGTTALSGGLIYLGGGTPVQKACGFDDTPDEMYKFLMLATGPEPDEPKTRLYCDESLEHYDWLVGHGVPFKHSAYHEPSMESPTDDCLVFTGGEDTWPFNVLARPAARGHKPQTQGSAGGFLMQRLIAALEQTSARVESDLGVETLVVDRDGRVQGLIASRDGAEWAVRATRGVILCAGGFILNEQMLARHAPVLQQCSVKLSGGLDDGRAIRMAQAIGAATIRMDSGECAVPISPPRPLVRGLLVNRFGQRFINEDSYFGRIGQAALFKQAGQMYFIHDDDTYEVSWIGVEAHAVADTIPELEAELELPEGSLQATMALYNRYAEKGEDPVFHKATHFIKPLTSPPYGAIRWCAPKAIYATFTLGGLHTPVSGEVLSAEGEPIPGLYAAGRTTSGVAAFGYVSGISLGDGTYFGRLAGRSVAQAPT
jgi:3-oxo-5alpha-steroid 4-dehydrogenase